VTYLLIIIVIVSYILLQTIEAISFSSRVAGKVASRHALGTTLQHSIFTISRLFLVFLLPTLAFLVENRISIELYITIVIISLLATSLVSYLVLFNLNYFQKLFQKIFNLYEEGHLPTAITRVFFNKHKINPNSLVSIPRFSMVYIVQKKTMVSFAAYTFLSTGYFVTFYLALIYNDYRLTFSQFSPVFHGVGAMILAFYIDPMLSRSIDKASDDESWLTNVYSIFLGRVLSYFISSIAFILIFIIWAR
jgi:hypothetical protein